MAEKKRRHRRKGLDARRLTAVLSAGTGALVVAGAALAITAAIVTPHVRTGASKVMAMVGPTEKPHTIGVKSADAKAAHAKAIAAHAPPMPGADVNFAAQSATSGSALQTWWAGHGASPAASSPGTSDSYTIAASGDALPGAGAGAGSPGSYSSDNGQNWSDWAPSAGGGQSFGSPGQGNFPPVYQAYNAPRSGPDNPGSGPGIYNPQNYVPGNTPPGNPPVYVPPGAPNTPPPPFVTPVVQSQPNSGGPGGSGTPSTNLPGQTPQKPLVPTGNTNPDVLTCAAPECQGNAWTYFDPEVAIGYNFQLVPSSGTPASDGVSMIRVSTDVGDGEYQFWMLNLAGTWVDMAPIDANPGGISADDFDVVSFLDGLTTAQDAEFGITDPADGLTQFSIRGIDPSADLDPNDPDEFVTGLQFSSPFEGDLDITPLELDTANNTESYGPTDDPAVPEPPALPVFVAALGLALAWREVRRFRLRPSRASEL